MKVHTTAAVLVLLAALGGSARAATATVNLEKIAAFALTPNTETLILALAAKQELVYIDTVAGKEVKRVKLEFEPIRLAVQGKTLFVASGAVVHILEVETGKKIKSVRAEGVVAELVVHPSKGPAFALKADGGICTIDANGEVKQTGVKKSSVAAVDPSAGAFLYVADDQTLTKYKVDDKDLKEVGALPKAFGSNVLGIQISPDGKQVAISAGYGWKGADDKYREGLPIYSTADVKTMLGEIEPRGPVAFHPVLQLAAVARPDGLTFFSTKSFAAGKKLVGPKAEATVLTFAAKGKKLIYGTTTGEKTTIRLIDLELTKDDEAAIEKVFPK